MKSRAQSWRGAFPAIVTPFTQDGMVDEELLKTNVRMTVEEGAHGIVVAGHNGEAHLMTQNERLRVIEIAVDEVSGRIPVIAGTGGIATGEVVELTKAAQRLGADGAMIEPPYFMTPKLDDLVAHYARIGETQFPIMLYNNPARAGVDLTIPAIARIMDVAPVAAVKDSMNDFTRITNLVYEFGDRLAVFVGPSRLFGLAGIVVGAHGFVDGLAQIAGRDANDLYNLAIDGKIEEARILQRRLFKLGDALFHSAGTSPATIKDGMNLMGRPGGYPRAPLRAMAGDDLDRFADRLRAAGYY